MAEKPEWYESTLQEQLAMNEQTWSTLQENGVDDSTELSLDFAYDAPGETEAEALATHLRAETDYEVSVEDGWVSGSTKPMRVSREILDQWVERMVAAGAEHGPCQFDGWGAELPD